MRALLPLSLTLAAACGSGPERAPGPLPDVVVVLIDTLRRDHLEVYGYERPTAPYLARLAERAVVFDRAYATSSWTAPTTATVFTGLYPPRHGVVLGFNAYGKEEEDGGGPEDAEDAEEADLLLSCLPAGLKTLPELLREAGYQTYGIASNVNIMPARGFGRGFDRFERQHKSDALELSQRILAWNTERDPARPAFWYLHFNDVHKPYDRREQWYVGPAQSGKRDELVALYDSEIGYVDAVLSELAGELGWGDDTLWVVLADHGEEFEDHGAYGHRFRLFQELVHVPLMIRPPGRTRGARVDRLVSQIDLLPTVADLLALEVEGARDGRSLVPLLEDPDADLGARTLFAQRCKPGSDKTLWAVIQERWKLVSLDTRERPSLYDLDADPRELDDVAREHPDVVAALMERLEVFQRVAPLESETLTVEMDEDLRGHLEEMGYAGDDDEGEGEE